MSDVCVVQISPSSFKWLITSPQRQTWPFMPHPLRQTRQQTFKLRLCRASSSITCAQIHLSVFLHTKRANVLTVGGKVTLRHGLMPFAGLLGDSRRLSWRLLEGSEQGRDKIQCLFIAEVWGFDRTLISLTMYFFKCRKKHLETSEAILRSSLENSTQLLYDRLLFMLFQSSFQPFSSDLPRKSIYAM